MSSPWELYNILTWWQDELTLDERRDVKKAWLVKLEDNEVHTGPHVNPMANAQVIMDYLKASDEYWAERLALKRPKACLKWQQFYAKIYKLTRESNSPSGKETPKKLPTQPSDGSTVQSPIVSDSF